MQISENTTVEKLVAKAGERERVLSSYEEYLGFIEEADTLNEFDDPDVIAVKFIFTEEETEETCWYLNPGFTSPYMKEHEHDVFLCNDLQGMPPEYIPEILLFHYKGILNFESFYNYLLKEGLTELSDEEKLDIYFATSWEDKM